MKNIWKNGSQKGSRIDYTVCPPCIEFELRLDCSFITSSSSSPVNSAIFFKGRVPSSSIRRALSDALFISPASRPLFVLLPVLLRLPHPTYPQEFYIFHSLLSGFPYRTSIISFWLLPRLALLSTPNMLFPLLT